MPPTANFSKYGAKKMLSAHRVITAAARYSLDSVRTHSFACGLLVPLCKVPLPMTLNPMSTRAIETFTLGPSLYQVLMNSGALCLSHKLSPPYCSPLLYAKTPCDSSKNNVIASTAAKKKDRELNSGISGNLTVL